MSDGTIYALSSGAAPSGVAVVRVSGPAAALCAERIAGLPRESKPGRSLRTLRDAAGDPIDRGLVLWFAGPHSFTGEDVVEFQVHGSRAVIQALFNFLNAIPGVRPAEAGAFARRAFANGKLDLSQAEGLADLIAAETEGQRRIALRAAGGAASIQAEEWRRALIAIQARVEAAIDFPDEDLPQGLDAEARGKLAALVASIDAGVRSGEQALRILHGFDVAVIGAPNAGKSSLLNRLAGSDIVIVSEKAGTTRDVVEARLDLGGVPVTLADTAGLREASDDIEQEGVARAARRAAAADLRLIVFDAATASGPAPEALVLSQPGDIWVGNKSDLASGGSPEGGVVPVSAKTGAGIDALLALLRERLGAVAPGDAAFFRTRHLAALADCRAALTLALATEGGPELLAEELRLAGRALGRIAGRVDIEDVLDVVFEEFCIGK